MLGRQVGMKYTGTLQWADFKGNLFFKVFLIFIFSQIDSQPAWHTTIITKVGPTLGTFQHAQGRYPARLYGIPGVHVQLKL